MTTNYDRNKSADHDSQGRIRYSRRSQTPRCNSGSTTQLVRSRVYLAAAFERANLGETTPGYCSCLIN